MYLAGALPRYADLKHRLKLNTWAWQTHEFDPWTWKTGNTQNLVFFLKKQMSRFAFLSYFTWNQERIWGFFVCASMQGVSFPSRLGQLSRFSPMNSTVPRAVDCLLPFSSTPFLFDSWEPCYGTFPLTTVIFVSFHAIPCGPPLQYSRTVTPTRCYIFKIVSVNEMPLGNTNWNRYMSNYRKARPVATLDDFCAPDRQDRRCRLSRGVNMSICQWWISSSGPTQEIWQTNIRKPSTDVGLLALLVMEVWNISGPFGSGKDVLSRRDRI